MADRCLENRTAMKVTCPAERSPERWAAYVPRVAGALDISREEGNAQGDT